ncbi:UDP-N-acetylglucosamine 2-epimerase (non-hydrolyzing) [Flavobacteriaceae bacterium]|nr:UDP-N-acetylglucosamine 2-epimerase (non-hydrolyzing) [Flavobacteriaceae bacterium]
MSRKKIKLVTVVGTRPEIIRLSSIIKRFEKSDVFEHYLIHTGQNYDYELNEIFFEDLDLPRPNIFLESASESPSKTIGNILIKMDDVLDNLKPDAFFILGDTNSCLSCIVAKKKKIPIFHFEAGNRCFDQRVPEESNRKIVDHIADINLTYSKIAKDYLILEGIKPDRVINIGSPMYEVIRENELKIESSKILDTLSLKSNNYFLVSCHREENVDNISNLKLLVDSINELCSKYKMPIVFPIHPRTRKKIDATNLELNKLVKVIKPLSFSNYCKLQIESFVVLSDSGTIFEESSILNFKSLNLRESHERPEAIEEASTIITGLVKEKIINGIDLLENQITGKNRNFNIVGDYNVPNLSLKVERIIVSYIDYVNRVVWQKES